MEVEDVYVPAVIEEDKSLKKARDVDVTVMDPCLFQVYRAISYMSLGDETGPKEDPYHHKVAPQLQEC